MPVSGAAGCANRLEGVEGSAGALDPSQVSFDELRRRTLTALLDAVGEFALQPIPVGHEALEIRIGCIRLGHQVEQVEGHRGSGQVSRDGGDDAPRRP